MAAQHEARLSVIVALVHETLNQDRFTDLADLAEAVKCRAARCHLRYDAALVWDAIDQVQRVRRVFDRPRTLPPDTLVSMPPIFDRDEAIRLLAAIRHRSQSVTVGQTRSPSVGPRPMPPAAPGDDERARRLRLVWQAILITAEHVDELEREDP